jgi:hypothetical protein
MLLVILWSRRRGLSRRRRLWGSTSTPRLFESCEELLHFTSLLESIVDRLYHCSSERNGSNNTPDDTHWRRKHRWGRDRL